MTNLTVQLVLKISTELDSQLDRAFVVAKERGIIQPTRTDYIRYILEQSCNQELANYRETRNVCVNDTILNKVIWSIFAKLALHKSEETVFRALHLDDFIYGARTKVEEIFEYLADNKCVRLSKDHKGIPCISHFDENLLRQEALKNLRGPSGMDLFGKMVSGWGIPGKGQAVSDMCFHLFGYMGMNAKESLDDGGFIITDNSNCHVKFMQGIIKDSPSEYSRQLWDIQTMLGENGKHSNLYVTFPDILLVK